jgi:hypothetical protein
VALLHSLLDKQCSWPVLETPTVSTIQILESKLHPLSVILALHLMLTQFLITSRTLHEKVTLSIFPEHLAIHVTMAQNVILRSGLRSNQTFINPQTSILMTFFTPLCTLRQTSYQVLPVSKKDFQDQVSYRIASLLGYQ